VLTVLGCLDGCWLVLLSWSSPPAPYPRAFAARRLDISCCLARMQCLAEPLHPGSMTRLLVSLGGHPSSSSLYLFSFFTGSLQFPNSSLYPRVFWFDFRKKKPASFSLGFVIMVGTGLRAACHFVLLFFLPTSDSAGGCEPPCLFSYLVLVGTFPPTILLDRGLYFFSLCRVSLPTGIRLLFLSRRRPPTLLTIPRPRFFALDSPCE